MSDEKVPGPGEVKHTELPDSWDGIRYELERIVRFIQEGRKDAIVIDTARDVAHLAVQVAEQLGIKVTEENRDQIHLEAIHVWCRDRFVYVRDPVHMELIQTPARHLRRLEANANWESYSRRFVERMKQELATKFGKSMEASIVTAPMMTGDSDEAVTISLAMAAAIGIEPLQLRLGGHDKQIHYVWGAAYVGGKWVDFDILHPEFGAHGDVEHYEDMAIPF